MLISFESFANPVDKLVQLKSEAGNQGLTYLPQFLNERLLNCQSFANDEYKNCLFQATQHAEEVLKCPHSQSRFDEGIEYDNWLSRETFLKNKPIEIPSRLQANFKKMIKSAISFSQFSMPFKFSISAYESPQKNAHAAIDGKIFFSSGLWKMDPILNDLELAAVAAHEMAHVIMGHGAKLNCMAVEWTHSHLSVREAQATVIEDFRGSIRFEKWSELSQQLEYEADQVAIKILKKSGFDPIWMSRALEKLSPKGGGGFTSGSHPDHEHRIRVAREASNRL
ncbi:MAG: M48 family metallopeptidase [Bdellovibrionales bacterium]